MAKLEKRENAPQGLTAVAAKPPTNSRCAVCRDPASKRWLNSWRVMDVCNNPECIKQGFKWVCNSHYSKRIDAPVMPRPVEYKFLNRRAPALEKPPLSRSRAR